MKNQGVYSQKPVSRVSDQLALKIPNVTRIVNKITEREKSKSPLKKVAIAAPQVNNFLAQKPEPAAVPSRSAASAMTSSALHPKHNQYAVYSKVSINLTKVETS